MKQLARFLFRIFTRNLHIVSRKLIVRVRAHIGEVKLGGILVTLFETFPIVDYGRFRLVEKCIARTKQKVSDSYKRLTTLTRNVAFVDDCAQRCRAAAAKNIPQIENLIAEQSPIDRRLLVERYRIIAPIEQELFDYSILGRRHRDHFDERFARRTQAFVLWLDSTAAYGPQINVETFRELGDSVENEMKIRQNITTKTENNEKSIFSLEFVEIVHGIVKV